MAQLTIRSLEEQISEFKAIADNHYQINSFAAGTLDGFASSGVTLYPAMWVTWETGSYEIGLQTFNYSIAVIDRVKKDRTNLVNVASDTKRIVGNIIAQLMSPDYGWRIEISSDHEPIFEPYHEDEVAGWTFDVTITQPYKPATCEIPFSSSPI